MNSYKTGRRVYWIDPDDDLCSGAGTITKGVDGEYVPKDAIIDVKKDDGGEIQVFMRELLTACASTGIHDDMNSKISGFTFGFGEPDEHGYFDLPDPVAARAAELRDNVPVGSYWPFP